MVLADTGRSIGAVTRLLREYLSIHMSETNGPAQFDVTVGRPEPQNNDGNFGQRLNLFLYELTFDPFLKNTYFREGDGNPIPSWLVLKYLMTAFDRNNESDSPDAHDLLGQGVQVLQSLGSLPISGSSLSGPLQDNPEALYITVESSSKDLLASLMQGSDEKYRLSVCFEVRPVMIASIEKPSYSLLVGIDYTKDPLEKIGSKGVSILTTASLGPSLYSLSPSKFEIGSVINLYGDNLSLNPLSVFFGAIELPCTPQSKTHVQFTVDRNIVNGDLISAGDNGLRVVHLLPSSRYRSSNILIGRLIPTLNSVTVTSVQQVDPTNTISEIYGTILLTGNLLGTADDDIFIGLYDNGKTVAVFEVPDIKPSQSPVLSQTQLILDIPQSKAVSPGIYQIILIVNGQQARNSPKINLESP